MARYFFNLTNGSTIRDPDGEMLPDIDAAKAAAARMASDLARYKRLSEIAGVYVGVTGEQGNEVFRERR